MLASAIGWALYSIYLFYWKTNLKIFDRFTLIAFFGMVSLLPFYMIEETFFVRTVFNSDFFMWVLFAAISPGIIAFTLYIQWHKRNLVHQLLVLHFIFLLFIVLFMVFYFLMNSLNIITI